LCGGPGIALPEKAAALPHNPKGTKMSKEIVFILLIPLCIVGVSWLARTILTKAKRRQNWRRVERGVADYLRQYS